MEQGLTLWLIPLTKIMSLPHKCPAPLTLTLKCPFANLWVPQLVTMSIMSIGIFTTVRISSWRYSIWKTLNVVTYIVENAYIVVANKGKTFLAGNNQFLVNIKTEEWRQWLLFDVLSSDIALMSLISFFKVENTLKLLYQYLLLSLLFTRISTWRV